MIKGVGILIGGVPFGVCGISLLGEKKVRVEREKKRDYYYYNGENRQEGEESLWRNKQGRRKISKNYCDASLPYFIIQLLLLGVQRKLRIITFIYPWGSRKN